MKCIFDSNKNWLPMENKPKQKIKLLPQYFKLIGVGLMILSIVPAAIIKLNHIQLPATGKEYSILFAKGLFLVGLAMIACSKDKKEDRSLMSIRLTSLLWAFFMAFSSVIFEPFFYLLFFGSNKRTSGTEVMFLMLFSYLMAYYLQKLGKSTMSKIQVDSSHSNLKR